MTSQTLTFTSSHPDAAAARVAVKRHMRKTVGFTYTWDSSRDSGQGDAFASFEKLQGWLVAHPIEAARILEKLVNASAKAWENNSGNARILEVSNAEHERKMRQAEIIAAVFGVSLDWPGLYPTLDHPNGNTYYPGGLPVYVKALKGE